MFRELDKISSPHCFQSWTVSVPLLTMFEEMLTQERAEAESPQSIEDGAGLPALPGLRRHLGTLTCSEVRHFFRATLTEQSLHVGETVGSFSISSFVLPYDLSLILTSFPNSFQETRSLGLRL